MQKQVKQATDLATGTAGSISGAAFGGTGGYQLWKSFWKYIRSLDTTISETGEIITGQDWVALEPLLTNFYIFLATGGVVTILHIINKFKAPKQ